MILVNTVSGNRFLFIFFGFYLFVYIFNCAAFSFQGGRKVEYPTDPKVTSGEEEREYWEVRE